MSGCTFIYSKIYTHNLYKDSSPGTERCHRYQAQAHQNGPIIKFDPLLHFSSSTVMFST